MIDELLDLLQPVIVMACVIAFSYIVYGYITLTIERDAKPCQTIIKTEDSMTFDPMYDMTDPWLDAFERPTNIQPPQNRDHEEIINISNQS